MKEVDLRIKSFDLLIYSHRNTTKVNYVPRKHMDH